MISHYCGKLITTVYYGHNGKEDNYFILNDYETFYVVYSF